MIRMPLLLHNEHFPRTLIEGWLEPYRPCKTRWYITHTGLLRISESVDQWQQRVS